MTKDRSHTLSSSAMLLHPSTNSKVAHPAIVFIAWLCAIVLAAIFDGSVSSYVHDHGIDAWVHHHDLLMRILKMPGVYYFTILLAIVVCLLHPLTWRAAALVLASGISGLLNSLLKWIVGRTRPFRLDASRLHGLSQPAPFILQPFRGGLAGLIHDKNLSFPSGHACVAFATATALAILWPRLRWAFCAIATLTAIERIVENAHYFSDTVAAAALSIAVVHLINRIGRPLFEDKPSTKVIHE